MNDFMDTESLIRSARFLPSSLQQPDSWVGHIPFANWLTNAAKPDVFVELGTHSGNSYFAFCQSIQEAGLPTKAYAVDTWAGDEHAGFYGKEVFDYVERTNKGYEHFSTLIRKTFEEAADMFPEKSIDLLHIDGLHTYDAVSKDFNTWLPKMSDRGIVILHDTYVFRHDFGVHKLFKELSTKYDSMSFLHSHGLGVLRIGAESPDFIPREGIELDLFKGAFEVFGTRFVKELANQKDINELVKSIFDLGQLHKQDAESLKLIKESLSWKATYPLRAIGSLFCVKNKERN
jgi:hypothetical protein